jgi:hypothetical protein
MCGFLERAGETCGGGGHAEEERAGELGLRGWRSHRGPDETTTTAGMRGKREWESWACEVGRAADDVESQASSACPASSGIGM